MKLEPNCIGKFQIATSFLESAWREIASAMPAMIVLNVEVEWLGQILTYTAASVHFDALREGEEIPMYRLNFSQRMGVRFFEGAERIKIDADRTP